jgi:hypothetical protein
LKPEDSKTAGGVSVTGTVLRSTTRGALVLETENARRMMQRLRHLKDSVDPQPRVAARVPKAAS